MMPLGIMSEKEITQTRPRVARSGTGEIRRSQHHHIEVRPTNLRSRDHQIRRMVLLGTAIGVQPDCRSSLQLVPTNGENFRTGCVGMPALRRGPSGLFWRLAV